MAPVDAGKARGLSRADEDPEVPTITIASAIAVSIGVILVPFALLAGLFLQGAAALVLIVLSGGLLLGGTIGLLI